MGIGLAEFKLCLYIKLEQINKYSKCHILQVFVHKLFEILQREKWFKN